MEDLSAKLGLNWKKGLTAGESMSGGNTVNHDPDNYAMSGPGSLPVNPTPVVLDSPGLDVPAPKDKPSHLVDGSGNGGAGSWTVSPMSTGFKKGSE